MAHLIEEARSNRSTCRTCKKSIEKDVIRVAIEKELEFNGPVPMI